MKIHKEGYKSIAAATIASAVLVVGIEYFHPAQTIFHYLAYIGLLVGMVIVVRFFRMPNRELIEDVDVVLCPADGTVVAIEEVFVDEFFNDKRLQVSVFMSPNNVHANWSPVSGLIKYTKYHKGSYLVAWHPKSSTHNERSTIVIERPSGLQLLVRQIAGAMARRIVTYAREGNSVRQGDEIGFIKFGSRVDVFLPMGSEVKVQLNQKVKGKTTILATVPTEIISQD